MRNIIIIIILSKTQHIWCEPFRITDEQQNQTHCSVSSPFDLWLDRLDINLGYSCSLCWCRMMSIECKDVNGFDEQYIQDIFWNNSPCKTRRLAVGPPLVRFTVLSHGAVGCSVDTDTDITFMLFVSARVCRALKSIFFLIWHAVLFHFSRPQSRRACPIHNAQRYRVTPRCE